MRVCFVVMAHHEPQIFGRLLRALASPAADVVVHIDRRVEISQFTRAAPAGVHFLEHRHAVNWSGWSQMVTTIDLLAAGLARSNADYFIFLAGTDFPIRRQSDLLQHLEDVFPYNLLNHYPLMPGLWGFGLIDTFRLIDFRSQSGDIRMADDPAASDERRLAKQIASEIEVGINRRFYPRNTGLTRFFHGSTRWCLNRETAAFLVDYFLSEESAPLRDYLSMCPNGDELFVPTAVFNSPLKHICLNFDDAETEDIFAGTRPPLPDEKRVYLHYIDWSPEREDPAILKLSDYPALRQSSKFFACKFLADRSTELLDVIERDLK